MNWRNRKLRLGIVLAIGVFVAFYAWRTSTPKVQPVDCSPGREEMKDDGGNVIEIRRTTCAG